MSLIQLLVVIIVLGLLYWLVMQLPLPEPFRRIAQVIVVVILIIWLLNLVGLLPGRIHLSALPNMSHSVELWQPAASETIQI